MSRLLDEAKRIIRINSVTSNGNEELANYAMSLMQDRGLKSQMQLVTHSIEDVSKRQFNVIGIMGDTLVDRKTRKGLLLNTHLDTVSPGLSENWTETGGNPFAVNIRDGRIYGLGTADVKLDFLCKLHAISKFREKKLRQPIYLAGTCGEEMGMFGAKYLIKSMFLNPKFVVVGEPSELKVVYAHKCMTIFRISIGYQLIERDARGFNRKVELTALGKSAHSSYPHLGKNAILSMLGFLERAVDNGFDIRFTGLSGGDTVNKVPDRATVQFYLTSHQFEDFKRFFREVLRSDSTKAAGAHKEGQPAGNFRVELGGVGDSGVRFLPDTLYTCLMDIVTFFQLIAAEFERTKDESYAPAHSTVNFGKLVQKPGGLDFYFDLRLLPNLDMLEIERRIQDGIHKIAKTYPNLNVTANRERSNPGLNMTMDHELVKICKDALEAARLPVNLDKKSTSTEAAQYFQAGYEAVIFGSGISSGNSHSPNEFNLLEQMEKSITFYERLIERVCL